MCAAIIVGQRIPSHTTPSLIKMHRDVSVQFVLRSFVGGVSVDAFHGPHENLSGWVSADMVSWVVGSLGITLSGVSQAQLNS